MYIGWCIACRHVKTMYCTLMNTESMVISSCVINSKTVNKISAAVLTMRNAGTIRYYIHFNSLLVSLCLYSHQYLSRSMTDVTRWQRSSIVEPSNAIPKTKKKKQAKSWKLCVTRNQHLLPISFAWSGASNIDSRWRPAAGRKPENRRTARKEKGQLRGLLGTTRTKEDRTLD